MANLLLIMLKQLFKHLWLFFRKFIMFIWIFHNVIEAVWVTVFTYYSIYAW